MAGAGISAREVRPSSASFSWDAFLSIPKEISRKNIISIGSFTKDLKILVCSTNIEIWFLKWKKQKIGKSEQNKLFIC
jgi:hypothetical protein